METFYTIDTEYMPGKENIDATFEYGVCKVVSGNVVDVQSYTVNPDCGDWGANIFGQEAGDYFDKPNWKTAITFLNELIPAGSAVFHHAGEDGSRVKRLYERADLSCVPYNIINTLPLTRLYLSDIAAPRGRERKEKHTIERFAARFNIDFDHHVASEDAHVLAAIVQEMISRVGLDELLQPRTKNLSNDGYKREKKALQELPVSASGRFVGELILFTDIPMGEVKELAEIAASLGFEIAKSLNQKVNFLIVGGGGKSSKPKKAAEMNEAGKANISILPVDEFREIICLG